MHGSELRRIRIDVLKMTQRDLAAELDVPRNTVARWERGELAIQHERMLRLALSAIRAQAGAVL
jgi:DNA-binding transcriptional regulator YiaG